MNFAVVIFLAAAFCFFMAALVAVARGEYFDFLTNLLMAIAVSLIAHKIRREP